MRIFLYFTKQEPHESDSVYPTDRIKQNTSSSGKYLANASALVSTNKSNSAPQRIRTHHFWRNVARNGRDRFEPAQINKTLNGINLHNIYLLFAQYDFKCLD